MSDAHGSLESRLDHPEVAATYRALVDHLDRFWPEQRKNLRSWNLGPLHLRLPMFRVCEVIPQPGERQWAYVSMGAWEASRDEPCGHEFVIVAPSQDPIHVETLAMATYLHLEPEQRLHFGHIVPIGRGWVEGSPMDRFLVTLPYPFGKKLEICDGAPKPIRILWLMPIYASESAYARTHGVEALERLFDDAGVQYADPQRPAVV